MTYSHTTPSKSPSASANGHPDCGSHNSRYGVPFPSPASTLTETSQPVTPLDGVALGGRLGQAQQNTHLAPIDEVTSIDFGSPLQFKKILYRSARADRSTVPTNRSITPRVPNEQLEVIHTILKSNASSLSPESPPAQINPENFVLRSRFSAQDDVFKVPRSSTPTRQTRSADVTPVKQRDYTTMSAHTTPSSSASKKAPVFGDLGVNEHDVDDVDVDVHEEEDELQHCSPRVDRLAEKPSVDNAQGLYLPNACVFVANLPKACEDDLLKTTVDKVFNEFGTCYTKVHRNVDGMPFAHVQYETNAIAEKAIKLGKGRDIEGRPCRTELSNAKVSLFVSRINGRPIDREEVLEILRQYGDIVMDWSPSPTEYALNKLPLHGMFFRFAFFLDCVDALQSLRSHPKYRVESRVEPQSQQAQRLAKRQSSSTQALPAPRRQMYTAQPMPAKVILICNLPVDTTWRTLAAVFGTFGTICACNVMLQLPAHFATATVEFTAASSAVAAVENQDGRPHAATGDHKLRVTFASCGTSSRPSLIRPSQKHEPQPWMVADHGRTRAPPAMHPYTTNMTSYPTPISYYTLSPPSGPDSPANIGPGYASQYYNMGGHGSPNLFGFTC